MKAYVLIALFVFSCMHKAYADEKPTATETYAVYTDVPTAIAMKRGQCVNEDGVFMSTFTASEVEKNFTQCQVQVNDLTDAIAKQPSGYTGESLLIVGVITFVLGAAATAYLVKK